jgi:hypothetical protein
MAFDHDAFYDCITALPLVLNLHLTTDCGIATTLSLPVTFVSTVWASSISRLCSLSLLFLARFTVIHLLLYFLLLVRNIIGFTPAIIAIVTDPSWCCMCLFTLAATTMVVRIPTLLLALELSDLEACQTLESLSGLYHHLALQQFNSLSSYCALGACCLSG